jgi:hypothetical protein
MNLEPWLSQRVQEYEDSRMFQKGKTVIINGLEFEVESSSLTIYQRDVAIGRSGATEWELQVRYYKEHT